MRDNPAQRLHDLLAALQATPQQLAQASLSTYFGLRQGDLAQLLQVLARVAVLPEQTEQELRSHPFFDEAVDLDWRPAVDAVVSGLLVVGGNDTQSLTRQYSEATLLGLRHAASKLARVGQPLPADELNDLGALLLDLDRAIREDASLSDPSGQNLRTLLLRITFEMHQSVDMVKASGVDGLQSAYEQLLGAMGSLLRQGRLDDVPPRLRERLVEVAVKYESMLSIASSGFSIAAGTASLFGIGS